MFQKFIISLIFTLPTIVCAQNLKLLGDTSGSDGEELSRRYCSKVMNVTQSVADNLSSSLQVSSDTIRFRNSWIKPTGVCCVVLDTPRGPLKFLVWQYYQGSKGGVIANMNVINTKSSDVSCEL